VTEASYLIGVDIGGTCTDCVVVDDEGTVSLAKTFSTPGDFSDGIVDVLVVAAEQREIELGELLARTHLFLHSTTVAENAIVNQDLAPTGLLVTRGFDQILFAMRGGYGRWSGLGEDEKRNPIFTDKPPPLVPRERIRAISERTVSDGTVLVHVSPEEVEAAIHDLLAAGSKALGVAFLWSFVNDQNERAASAVIERLAPPGTFLSVSSELAPTIGEYERTSTVALNSALGPVVGKYLTELESKLRGHGLAVPLLVMQAYGGLLPISKALRLPAGLIESGPVSGVVGCAYLGSLLGAENIISADLGGTTFKVGTIRKGAIEYQREPRVVRYHYALSKLDVESLGVAGGSIISIDERTGVPRVGPRSAGSYPGPVCYANGGNEPTVTDVDAVLGFLNADLFLGGRARLDIEAGRAAFEERVASKLALEPLAAAAAIYRLTNSLIYDLLHKTTIQRGLDPRSFALFSTGGTAGMHLPAIGRQLGTKEITVPNTASVQGAFGLVTTDVVHEEIVTRPTRLPVSSTVLDDRFTELTDRIVGQLRDEGFSEDSIAVQWAIDMRYRRQVHVLTVPIAGEASEAGSRFTEDTLDRALIDFEALYRQRYGPESAYTEAGVELVTFRVRGSGRVQRPALARAELGDPDPSSAVVEERHVYAPDLDQFVEASCYLFERLQPGNQVEGPAVIWTPITTVVLGTQQVAEVDPYKNLRITAR
jgi:N-methylhydantoinase A